MTYTAKSAYELRNTAGSVLDKLAAEIELIDAAMGDLDTFDGLVTGTNLNTVAESNVIGGVPQVFMVPITAGAIGNTDITVTHKIRVIDAYLILRGAGVTSTTLQVFNGTSGAITDTMAVSGSDTSLVRAEYLNDAYYEIAAGGKLRITTASGASQPNALVVVTAVRVA